MALSPAQYLGQREKERGREREKRGGGRVRERERERERKRAGRTGRAHEDSSLFFEAVSAVVWSRPRTHSRSESAANQPGPSKDGTTKKGLNTWNSSLKDLEFKF